MTRYFVVDGLASTYLLYVEDEPFNRMIAKMEAPDPIRSSDPAKVAAMFATLLSGTIVSASKNQNQGSIFIECSELPVATPDEPNIDHLNQPNTPTPGPWEVNESFTSVYCDHPDMDEIIVCVGKTDAAFFSNVTGRHEANYRLIAAAPELLESLQDVLAAIDDGSVGWIEQEVENADALIERLTKGNNQ